PVRGLRRAARPLHVHPLAHLLRGGDLPGLGDRAGHGQHLTDLPLRGSGPPGSRGHPDGADRLAPDPGIGQRTAGPPVLGEPDPYSPGADMTPTPDEEPQSRPLAVFKAPKPKAAANDTTALAD